MVVSFRYGSQCNALVAQSVERNHGKVEVTGSNPVGGSKSKKLLNEKFQETSISTLNRGFYFISLI